ncbi:hypothetical protein AVEN_155029-1 [Araneus ventricosus]|uniref:Uncharacterized protein n=1 Tax=Araneus ventricosus TaxID=182803 RepID=A0A4Y2A8S2_ARAVE|nr:hypothetical protein AVEN_155029-1 [Araneus ventricosus]
MSGCRNLDIVITIKSPSRETKNIQIVSEFPFHQYLPLSTKNLAPIQVGAMPMALTFSLAMRQTLQARQASRSQGSTYLPRDLPSSSPFRTPLIGSRRGGQIDHIVCKERRGKIKKLQGTKRNILELLI